jgi:hypothetical protein
MPNTVGSVSDGPNITVRQLVAEPLMLPTRTIDLLDNSFLTDVIFRDAGRNGAGVVQYEESMPLFLAGDPEDVAEYAEIPVSASVSVAFRSSRSA